jgi:hypothetical protein
MILGKQTPEKNEIGTITFRGSETPPAVKVYPPFDHCALGGLLRVPEFPALPGLFKPRINHLDFYVNG